MAEVNIIDWHVTPFRAERWYEGWLPAVERSLGFGATAYALTRSEDDPLHFRQTTHWESRDDFDRYWSSEEIGRAREAIMAYYAKPLLPTWHQLIATE